MAAHFLAMCGHLTFEVLDASRNHHGRYLETEHFLVSWSSYLSIVIDIAPPQNEGSTNVPPPACQRCNQQTRITVN